MIQKFTGSNQVHESNRSFADVVADLEKAVGAVENETFAGEVSQARDPSDFEARMRKRDSTSGFMRFPAIDRGAWLAVLGNSGKAKM